VICHCGPPLQYAKKVIVSEPLVNFTTAEDPNADCCTVHPSLGAAPNTVTFRDVKHAVTMLPFRCLVC
jgi:hypothetical protein